jgi:hypothetical protein
MKGTKFGRGLATLAVLGAACSKAPSQANSRNTSTSSSPAGIAAAGSGGGGSELTRDRSGLGNPDGLVARAPTAVGGSGGAGVANLPAGCEVGKFCAPTEPDPTNCGTLTLAQDVEVKRDPGNLLLVFDQSLSMGEAWGSSGERKTRSSTRSRLCKIR